MKTITLKDIAERAKVSIATVSRAINHPDKVDDETLIKIRHAIKDLNYVPNRVAQRLRVKRGNRKLIGVLLADIQNPFYVDILRGIEEVAYSKGFTIFIGEFSQERDKEKMYLEKMKSELIDGLIVAPSSEVDQDVIEIVKSGLPVVCVDRGLKGVEVDSVLVDNRKGAYEAVEYLISLGYRRIAYIGGLPQIPTTIQRLEGYKEALLRHNIPIDQNLVQLGDSKIESGGALAEKLLTMSNPPDALFTGNNLITLGALRAIYKLGLRIPDDVAIIGFDDMFWAEFLNPPLTAVYQPGFEIGRRAAELLFLRLSNPKRPHVRVILEPKLIKRKSC